MYIDTAYISSFLY